MFRADLVSSFSKALLTDKSEVFSYFYNFIYRQVVCLRSKAKVNLAALSGSLLLVLFLFAAGNLKAQNILQDDPNNDEDFCLEVSGKATLKDSKSAGKYKAELVLWNIVVDSLFIKDNKRFIFNLKKNAHYAIRISKEGHLTRLIGFSTYIGNSKYKDVFCKFRFNTEFISELESDNLDTDALDFPIAIIAFDEKSGAFDYSKKYTSYIKDLIYLRTNGKSGIRAKY
jgi:hypothetical protein